MASERNICLYQDSEKHYISIQIALLSIFEHEPNWRCHVYLTRNDTWLAAWIQQFPAVFIHKAEPAQNGFNAKPLVINDCLSSTQGEVIWFDSDMILTQPLSPWLDTIPDHHCIVAENPPGDWPDGTEMRTLGWGFKIGRSITKTINSCFIRFNQHHRDLSRAWLEAVRRPDYAAAQARHWSKRPAYFLGDQDALNALIGSYQFQNIDITLLRDGKDIAQCFNATGYSWINRLANAFVGLPPIIHSQGEKPWLSHKRLPVYLDVSSYKLYALRYRDLMYQTDWLAPKTTIGRLLTTVFWADPNLTGLPSSILGAARARVGTLVHPVRGRKLRGMNGINKQ